MSKEIEARVLNIQPEKLQISLLNLGAKLVGEYDFKRYVFDTIPKTSDRWVRLRTNGTETTLTVKEIQSDSYDGTNEWEIKVSDFDTTLTILQKIGINPRGYQENTRKEYALDNVSFMLDHWPILGHILEIEVQDPSDIEKYAQLLEIDPSDITTKDINSLFLEKGIDLKKTESLKF